MFHQAHARRIGDALRQQAVDERDHPPKDVGHDCQREFGQNEKAERGEKTAVQPLLERLGFGRRLRQPHDVVDNQLADIERGDRREGANEPQRDRSRGEARARPPHHRDEGPQIAQRADPLLE